MPSLGRSDVTRKISISIRENEAVTALAYPASSSRIGATLVLAHGAGAGQSSPFMVRFATGLSSRGLDVLTFNFLYTEQRRRVPDRTDKLEVCYRAAIEAARHDDPFRANNLFIGGKSMGGRIASHLAAQQSDEPGPITGLIVLGYPLHPPGKPDQLRAVHLTTIRVPMLFVQGSRDPFGTPSELRHVLDGLSASVTLHLVENGDHSLVPSKTGLLRRSAEQEGERSPSVDEIYGEVQDTIVNWVRGVRST
jgi:predicted alpha/beta-hydrolase family hydrolase